SSAASPPQRSSTWTPPRDGRSGGVTLPRGLRRSAGPAAILAVTALLIAAVLRLRPSGDPPAEDTAATPAVRPRRHPDRRRTAHRGVPREDRGDARGGGGLTWGSASCPPSSAAASPCSAPAGRGGPGRRSAPRRAARADHHGGAPRLRAAPRARDPRGAGHRAGTDGGPVRCRPRGAAGRVRAVLR